MPLYRLNFLGRSDGRIVHRYQLEARSDREALNFASVWDEDVPMDCCEDVRLQLWERRRDQISKYYRKLRCISRMAD